MTNSNVRQAVRWALAAVATASSPMAFAQNAPAPAASPSLEEVVITGSRLSQAPNDISISPVTTVTSLDIQQTGLVRAEDLLNNLPQVIAENGSGQAISSNGTATVSLRGLGSQRTLVLINGRRMSPGAGLGTSSSPDINQIPADLVQRVDVLTGGASAVYGADAVAGVVNFVLNTKFEGVQVDANYGFGQHKNDAAGQIDALTRKNIALPPSNVNIGHTKDVSFLAGANFADGKGNATVYATYLNAQPVVGNKLDYAACTLNSPGSNPGGAGKKYACGGSSSSATGRFLELGLGSNGRSTTMIDANGVPVDNTVAGADGYRQYTSSQDAYNYGALSYAQRQMERYTAGAFLNYDVNDHVNVYSETMYAHNASRAEYGASGLFAFGHTVVNCDTNPLLSDLQKATICVPSNVLGNQAQFNAAPYGPTQTGFGLSGNEVLMYTARRSVESGPRVDNYSSNAFRQVIGSKGSINDAWKYDVYGQVGLTQMQLIENNFLGTEQIDRALNVVADANGNPVCVSKLQGWDTACVPWNIWTPGGVTQDQLNYLRVASGYAVKSTEYIVSGYLSGDLSKYGVKLPSAASGLDISLGTEYREEKYDFDPDYIFGNGFASGGNGKFSPIHGGFHVAEVFTEFRLPLIDEKPGAYLLSLEGGYRYSSYTSGFNTNTFKVGLEWAPIKDVRIRGGYNRAIRAPSIGDLLTPAVIGSGGAADPCWGSTPTFTLAQCERTGVTEGQYGHILANPAAQINTSLAGLNSLTPEVADTYSLGFVVQPAGIPNLVVSLDYYDIKIKNTIATLSSDTVLAACANSVAGDANAMFCDLIHRGPSGSLWFNVGNYIDTHERNIGGITTKGIDLAAHYGFNMNSWGKMNLSFSGTKLQSYATQPTDTGGAYDCAGYFGTTCSNTSGPLPKWRHVAAANWATPWAGLDLTLRWRYIGKVDTDRTSSDPQLAKDYFPGTAHISAYNYIDMSASMPLATGVTFRLGINNLQDKTPPIVINGNYSDCPNLTCNDNTYVGTYDTLGRYIYAHVSAKF
jgi:outer membrane receptor protein involved in Fe transport